MDTQMNFIREIPTPEELKAQFPLSQNVSKIKAERDEIIQKIFEDNDNRFLLVIGPCSADREDAVLEYMARLMKVQENVKEKIFMIPRVYTNKPRTKGVGYKGMLHQPNPQGEEDMLKGIIAIRGLHARVMEETGFSCAEEMLYPDNHMYLSDLLSYVAIGARSVEDQQHRIVASGVGIPAGMKNPTSGDISIMMNSITAAQSRQKFLYRGWEVTTQGNPLAHAILRGFVDAYGRTHSNYHYEDLRLLIDAYSESKLKNPAVIVDCNHANSGKKYLEQIRIAKDVIHSCHASDDIKKIVKGLMIESYLQDGCQPVSGDEYGKSITDPCLGWEKTEKLIYELAELL